MTFEAYEISAESGQPVELYEFVVYGVTYRYTSAGYDYTYDSHIYTAVPLAHGEIEDTDELAKEDLTITAPRDFAINEFFRVAPPSDVILLTIFTLHRADADLQRKAFWTGRVLNCSTSGITASLTCENVYTSLRRNGLMRTYGRLCPLELYRSGPGFCNVPIEDFKITVNVTNVEGLILTAGIFASYDDGRFAGGFISWEATPGQIEERAIKAHVGDQISLTHPIVGLPAGAEIVAAPGCRHTVSDCNGFFTNMDNYGGFPDITTDNPFGANNVFLGVNS